MQNFRDWKSRIKVYASNAEHELKYANCLGYRLVEEEKDSNIEVSRISAGDDFVARIPFHVIHVAQLHALT